METLEHEVTINNRGMKRKKFLFYNFKPFGIKNEKYNTKILQTKTLY